VWNELARTPGDFLSATWETLRVTLLGGLLGGLVGMLIGYPLGKIRALERLLSPFVVAAQSTPIVVLAPLLVIWFGFGTLPAVLVSALSALYPIMISTMVGVREVRPTDHELFTTLGATTGQRLFRLELPSALPVMLGGLRLSLSLALTAPSSAPTIDACGTAPGSAAAAWHRAVQAAARTASEGSMRRSTTADMI
jgi:NitT/TauT family transport system ATP-binding protein